MGRFISEERDTRLIGYQDEEYSTTSGRFVMPAYGCPPVEPTVPTPEQIDAQRTAELEPEIRKVVGYAIDQLSLGHASVWVSHAERLVIHEVAKRFVAAGWAVTFGSTNDGERIAATISKPAEEG